jgi:hypothetical protein
VSHYIPRFGSAGGAPYYLKALVDERDVTKKLDLAKVLEDVPTRFRRPGGKDGQVLTASSAAAIVLATAENSGSFMHAPAPSGLPGGYPVRVDASGGKIVLPEDLTLEKAISINEEGQRFDGIERIEKDGTVRFTQNSAGIMREMIGYDCDAMKLDETEERSRELGIKFKEFAKKYQ